MLVRTNVNGEWREADVWPGSSLLYVLREHLGLPGSKNACEQGECGSCSVWLDGELVCACLVLAAQAHGREVRTVEGPRQGAPPEDPAGVAPVRSRAAHVVDRRRRGGHPLAELVERGVREGGRGIVPPARVGDGSRGEALGIGRPDDGGSHRS